MSKREHISSELRNQVFIRDGFRCRYCGSQKMPFHLDHVYPVSKGGETTIDNLVTACAACNERKSNKVGIWPWPNEALPKPKKSWHWYATFFFSFQAIVLIFILYFGGASDPDWPMLLLTLAAVVVTIGISVLFGINDTHRR